MQMTNTKVFEQPEFEPPVPHMAHDRDTLLLHWYHTIVITLNTQWFRSCYGDIFEVVYVSIS